MSRIFCETWGFRRKLLNKCRPPHPNPPLAWKGISNLSFRHATEGSNEESALDFAALTLPNLGTTVEEARVPHVSHLLRDVGISPKAPQQMPAAPPKPSFGLEGDFEFVIPTRDRREQRGICS